jgi:dihydrolipoamide dehydrogenase
VVLGGGVIGVEFASAWRSFGVEVTVVEALPRLVPKEEPEISAALQRAFGKRGIRTWTGAAIDAVQVDDPGVTVTVGERSVTADLLLVAVGRDPATDGLGFAEAGIELDRGWVRTDRRLQTSVPGVYAIGDLVPGLQLAHRGFAHGIFVAEQFAADGRAAGSAAGSAATPGDPPVVIEDEAIPRVTYCRPEIASVGLSEAAARDRYGEVVTARYDLAGNGRSQILRAQGFVKVIRRVDGPVVGVHMIGSGVGELIGEAQLIYNWEAHPSEVAQLIHAHPTQGEALGEVHLALAGKPLHVHG